MATLQQLGIFSNRPAGSVATLQLSSRFGDELLRQFDLLLGRSREVLVPYRPPPVFHADWQLDHPTTKRTALRVDSGATGPTRIPAVSSEGGGRSGVGLSLALCCRS